MLTELASPLPLPLLADVDFREPWVVLVELMDLGDALLVALGFWVVRSRLLAWGDSQ